jgi:hypothetical protein
MLLLFHIYTILHGGGNLTKTYYTIKLSLYDTATMVRYLLNVSAILPCTTHSLSLKCSRNTSIYIFSIGTKKFFPPATFVQVFGAFSVEKGVLNFYFRHFPKFFPNIQIYNVPKILNTTKMLLIYVCFGTMLHAMLFVCEFSRICLSL